MHNRYKIVRLYTLSKATRACHKPYRLATRRYTGRRGNSTRHTGKSAINATVGKNTTSGLMSKKYTTAEYE